MTSRQLPPTIKATARFRHVLFDLDGTLVDSSPGILTSFGRTLARHGVTPAVPLDRGLIGPPLAITLARISGLAGEAVASMMDTFKADYDTVGYLDTTPYTGVGATLAALRRLGLTLFVATNKRLIPTRKILAHLGWRQYFAGVYSLDAMQPPLPDKCAMVGEILRREAIDADRAAFVGDSAEDARAAAANGISFYAATWGYGGLAEAELHPDWKRLSGLAELLHHVQE